MITGTHDTITVKDGDGDRLELRAAVGRPLLAANASVMGCNITQDDAVPLGLFLLLWGLGAEVGEAPASATAAQIDELVRAGLALKMELSTVDTLEEGDVPSFGRFVRALHALPETKAEVAVQKAKLHACLNKPFDAPPER